MKRETKLNLAIIFTLLATVLLWMAGGSPFPPAIVSAQGRLVWFTLPDITGAGTTTALSVTGQSARMCQLVALSTNSAVARWGDASTAVARGATIAPGGGQFIPPGGTSSAYAIDLTTTYVYVATGDKLTVTCAR